MAGERAARRSCSSQAICSSGRRIATPVYLDGAEDREVHAADVDGVVKVTLVSPEATEIVVGEVYLVVVAGDVEQSRARTLEHLDERAVALEIRLATLVFDRVTQVDEQLGPFVSIQALYDRGEELRRAVRELSELAFVIGGRTEMNVRNERETHAQVLARGRAGSKDRAS